MLRVLCVMLLAVSCVAQAGERYREVWNPPESRHAVHASGHAQQKPAAHRLAAKRPTKAKPSHVAAGVPKATKRQRIARTQPVNAVPHAWNRPPFYVPEGNILRVASRGARPAIAR